MRTLQLNFPVPRIGSRIGLRDILLRVLRWCERCGARDRQRRQLAALDDRLLADIGITQVEQRLESRKLFWRT